MSGTVGMGAGPQAGAPSSDEELMVLIDQDHSRTTAFIDGVLSRTNSLRQFAITVLLGIVGFAFQQDSWPLALLGAAVVWPFAYLDLLNSVLYSRALAHERRIETLRRLRFRHLQRQSYDPDAYLELREALERFRYGVVANLSAPSLRAFREARPAAVFTRFYPALSLVAAVSGAVIALT